MGQVLMHADAYFLDQDVGHSINGARVIGALTDALVVSADTNAGLQANIRTFAGHADTQPLIPLINRAIQVGKDDGSLTDAQILSETTIAGLVADTYADPLKPWPLIV
jgi:hypothetical protein